MILQRKKKERRKEEKKKGPNAWIPALILANSYAFTILHSDYLQVNHNIYPASSLAQNGFKSEMVGIIKATSIYPSKYRASLNLACDGVKKSLLGYARRLAFVEWSEE